MQYGIRNLLCFPNEILEMITQHLEYAYEINSLSRTCRRLYSVPNCCLFAHYAKECSPPGLERIVRNDNTGALYKLLVNGLDFDQYFRMTGRSTPIILAVDKDLSRTAQLLVVYSEVFLQNDRCKYGSSLGSPDHKAHRDDLERTLYRAANKGSLGVVKVLVSSAAVENWQKAIALAYAVDRGHLAVARCLIEEGKVNVNQKICLTGFFASFLAQSASRGALEMVKLLVEAGAALDCPSFQRMVESPLCIAAARNHGAIVQYLIEMGLRFPRVKFFDILDLAEFSDMPNYTIWNLVKGGGDLQAIMTGPQYQGCGGYARSCFYRVIAACNNQPLYQECWDMRGASHDWQHLRSSFGIAVLHGNLALARYIVDEMVNSHRILWGREWSNFISYTISYESVPAFDLLLNRGPPGDLPEAMKGWLNDVLAEARGYPEHMAALLRHGYLDETKDIWILKDMLAGAFEVGNLAFVWRLIEHGELGLLDALNGPDLEHHDQAVLHIAAQYSPRKTFQEFLSTGNLTLDPSHPTHCAALVSAAVGTNVYVVSYFLDAGFEFNALYEASASKEDHVPEALMIQVATAHASTDDYLDKRTCEDAAATMMFFLDRGAQIDTQSSRGRTALSLALENGNPELAKALLNRGADPLIALESHDNLSALEQLVLIFIRHEYDVSHLDMLQASLETMAARNYQSDDFFRLMPSIEGTLSRPIVISQIEDAPNVKGPIALPYNEDKDYVRWSHFFLIRELRKQYWRAKHPVSSE
ncbi:ankyrin [Penicillium argentinense]|uniref:Ankyrin n=1 Tax=Penicillium argentinense TaxID=1131581 RepID=A0A9W9FLJ3_9EURO|nr:ankyrin [Penicillium argentinense]KAJ5102459.1 ankyrin [Penicillium argentinense]